MSYNHFHQQDIWEPVRAKQIEKLSKLASYSRKYKQYLNGDYTLAIIKQARSQLMQSDDIIDIIELVCELDLYNQLTPIDQQSHFTPKLKHIYDKRYCYFYSFRSSRNNLTGFLHCLNQCITTFDTIDNINRKYSLLLHFKLGFDAYIKYFQIKKLLH